jgi:ribosomal protein L37AE/L43A
VCKKRNAIGLQEDKSCSRITLNHIFSHNHNWDVYRSKHAKDLRDVEIAEVEKMLTCGDRGYRLYICPECHETETIHFGCNSRVCTHCGKKFADKWADRIVKHTFDVKHRHVVLTIPEHLRPYFNHDRRLLKVLMDCSIKVTSYVLKQKLKKQAVPGVIAVVHTYGKDMKFNPHVHCLVTEGGFKKDGEWVNLNVFPYSLLRKSWQYHLLTDMKKAIPATPENSKLIDGLFKEYPKGFYVRAKDTVDKPGRRYGKAPCRDDRRGIHLRSDRAHTR